MNLEIGLVADSDYKGNLFVAVGGNADGESYALTVWIVE